MSIKDQIEELKTINPFSNRRHADALNETLEDIHEIAGELSYLPTEERWVDNVVGTDTPTSGTRDNPYLTIVYAMDQLKAYGKSSLKVLNILFTGTQYQGVMLCNTSNWYIRGVSGPTSSPDGGGLQKVSVTGLSSGPYALYHTLIITNLTDEAIDDFYNAPEHPMYNHTDTNIEWVGPDLTASAVQDISLVDQSQSGTLADINVTIENMTLTCTVIPTRDISGTTHLNGCAALILGKSPTYPTALYGAINGIYINRVRGARMFVLKNCGEVNFKSSLDFAGLLLDNCRGSIGLEDPRPMGTIHFRGGNTNSSTNEVFSLNPASANIVPMVFMSTPLCLVGPSSSTLTRGYLMKIVGTSAASGLFASSGTAEVRSAIYSHSPTGVNTFCGSNTSITKNAGSRKEACSLELFSSLVVADAAIVMSNPTKIMGPVTVTSSANSSLANGIVDGIVTLSGSGTITFDRIRFNAAVTVTTGTVIFNDCTFASNLTVSGGTVTLNDGNVIGTATRSAGTATANMTRFKNARVGTWTYNAAV